MIEVCIITIENSSLISRADFASANCTLLVTKIPKVIKSSVINDMSPRIPNSIMMAVVFRLNVCQDISRRRPSRMNITATGKCWIYAFWSWRDSIIICQNRTAFFLKNQCFVIVFNGHRRRTCLFITERNGISSCCSGRNCS